MNIIEAVKELKLGKVIDRKSRRAIEKTYCIKPHKLSIMIFLVDDILADDWEVMED
jgi:hypothetical protein